MENRMSELFKVLGLYAHFMPSNMTVDEILDCCGCTVDEDGEILDSNGKGTGIWWEEVAY